MTVKIKIAQDSVTRRPYVAKTAHEGLATWDRSGLPPSLYLGHDLEAEGFVLDRRQQMRNKTPGIVMANQTP